MTLFPRLGYHPTLRACNSPYVQDYFKRLFVLCSLEMIFSFLIKRSRQKAIEIEIAFFHPLGNGRKLDYSPWEWSQVGLFPLGMVASWIIPLGNGRKLDYSPWEWSQVGLFPLGMVASWIIPLGNGRKLDYFFYASYIRHNFPYKLILLSLSYLKYF